MLDQNRILTLKSVKQIGIVSIAVSLSLFYANILFAETNFQGRLNSVVINKASGENQAPIISFSYSVTENSITVDASGSTDADGTIASYTWDFGDASGTISGNSAQHEYASYGSYNVSLTVSDNDGGISILSKSVAINLPAEMVGNDIAGSISMKNYPNYVFFHKLEGVPASSGNLSSYSVTIAAAAASGRLINIALYSHDSSNNKPLAYISGSETGWLEYSQGTGETLVANPTGSVSIASGQQYWIGVRGKSYGGIRGDATSRTYYGYYLGESSSWNNVDRLSTETILTGTAGKLQIEVSP